MEAAESLFQCLELVADREMSASVDGKLAKQSVDALYAERGLCQGIVAHDRDYLVRIKGNRPEVLAALADGFAGEELGDPGAEWVVCVALRESNSQILR